MFTQVRSANRRVSPAEDNKHKVVIKAVYVVLEPQYQNSLTEAAKLINQIQGPIGIELNGYLIEELRDDNNYNDFVEDISKADIFIASLIFIEDLAQKIVDAVLPYKENLKASVIFPSMPEVMRLNKLGSFSMSQLGQSKSIIGDLIKKKKEADGASFQDSMLKLLNTLPSILKYLPVEKAQDARTFILSFQYWLGGTTENIKNLLLMLSEKYVVSEEIKQQLDEFNKLPLGHPLKQPSQESIMRARQQWNITDRPSWEMDQNG